MLANFTAEEQWVRRAILDDHGVALGSEAGVPDGRPLRAEGDSVILLPYQFAWIAA